jgi:DNA-binding NarL/FixJ family response regulator
MHDDAALARATLGAGAAGYIVKAAADVELMTAVRAVHRGRTFVDLDWGSEQGRASPGAPTPGFAGASRTARLSRREREVLSLLAQGHTNQEIAQRLDVSVKTVETYRARISNKFGLRSRADLVRFAIETGLLGPKTFA